MENGLSIANRQPACKIGDRAMGTAGKQTATKHSPAH
jgi:hypothetical protein